MNADDFKITEKWKEEKLIGFGRLPAHYIMEQKTQFPFSHYVEFSDEAWELAGHYRKVRSLRNRKALQEVFEKYR